ncbi:MAG: DUF2911 domain-containing protein [Cyclobacteriaceae bacterium]|nr:DUF2911 domain-containing protein [Cyclobacteriaceae bacterium]
MKKILLISGLLVVVLAVIAVIYGFNKTKSYSPESKVVFDDGPLKIRVFYNRPFKKGRTIFGGLVPYGKTWRTGANEATTFETNQDLMIAGKKLVAGKYSLWTVPNEQNWSVVFNSTIPNWGIDVMKDGEAARNPDTDVVILDVPVVATQKEFEQFTISLEKSDDMVELVMAWDKTLISVPLSTRE